MRRRYIEELQMLHVQITKMGSLCEEAIETASQLLFEDNQEKYNQVQELEDAIDHQNRVIEDHCMRLILLEQPVARDLKQVSAALKMIVDLERIGDQTLDIAQLPVFPSFSMQVQLDDMTAMCGEMLQTTIRAFVGNDLKLAQEVLKMDDIVDDLFLKIKEESVKIIIQDPNAAADILNLMMAAKYLERIGDHTVNIAVSIVNSLSEQHWG